MLVFIIIVLYINENINNIIILEIKFKPNRTEAADACR
jgi:hypothetical protein